MEAFMNTRHRAGIIVLLAALVAGTAGGASPRRALAADGLSGTVTITDRGSYSDVSRVADTGSWMTCEETIAVHRDGSATETIAYTYHEVSQQDNNGYQSTHSVDIVGSGTVQYDPELYANIQPDGTYYLGFGTADPGIMAQETATDQQTGQPAHTIRTLIVVDCQYDPGLLRGKLGGGPVLRIMATKDGHWNSEEDHDDYGPLTLIVKVEDPNLAPGQGQGRGKQPQPQPSPQPGTGCTGRVAGRAGVIGAAPRIRALGTVESPVSQGGSCQGRWRGTIRQAGNTSVAVTAHFGQQSTATWYIDWQCDETTRFDANGYTTETGTYRGIVTIVDDRTGRRLATIDLKPGGEQGNGSNGGYSTLTVEQGRDGRYLLTWNPIDLFVTASVNGMPYDAPGVYCIPSQNVSGKYGIQLPNPPGPDDVITSRRIKVQRTYPSNLSVAMLRYLSGLSLQIFGPPGYTFDPRDLNLHYTSPRLPLPPRQQLNKGTLYIDLYR